MEFTVTVALCYKVIGLAKCGKTNIPNTVCQAPGLTDCTV